MRTARIEILTFDELDESGKENARQWMRSCDPWGWQEEWWASAQEFACIAPISIDSADYDRRHVGYRWDQDDEIAELSGLRAWKWLENNGWFDWARKESPGACSLTGFCGDAAFADPLVEYAKTPLRVPDLKQVFYECAQSWVSEAADDMEHAYSDEGIDDMILANEYEFTSDGHVY